MRLTRKMKKTKKPIKSKVLKRRTKKRVKKSKRTRFGGVYESLEELDNKPNMSVTNEHMGDLNPQKVRFYSKDLPSKNIEYKNSDKFNYKIGEYPPDFTEFTSMNDKKSKSQPRRSKKIKKKINFKKNTK